MKRLLLLGLLPVLFLTGCGNKAVLKTHDLLASEVLKSLNGAEFTPCDADYVTNSFEFEKSPTAHALYFGNEFGVEFGVFAFADNATARKEALKIDD